MNVHQLYDTLRFIDNLDTQLELQAKLESIRDALAALTAQPANAQQQNSLANAMAGFTSSTSELPARITPAQMTRIAETGGEEYFSPGMDSEVRAVIGTNAMTPSVARDFVVQLAQSRAKYLRNVTATHQGMHELGVHGESPQPGSAEMAFLVPRALFKNDLGPFAKEIEFINQLVRDYSEVVLGNAEPVPLQQISSSIPTIVLAASVPVMLAIGQVLNKFLDAWKKVEEIREIRQRLSNIGMKGVALDELTEQIKTTVDNVVKESTKQLIAASPVDSGRANELTIALDRDNLKLFSKVERGLVIEIRVEPAPTDDPASEKGPVVDLRSLSYSLKFPQITGEPILLNGEAGEAEPSDAGEQRGTDAPSDDANQNKTRRPRRIVPQS